MAEKAPKWIRDKWYKLQKNDHAREWDSMESFAEWCKREAGGLVHGLAIRRFDPEKPWGPDNCYLQKLDIKEPDIKEPAPNKDAIKWNKTVNVFRRAAGLPLFREE